LWILGLESSREANCDFSRRKKDVKYRPVSIARATVSLKALLSRFAFIFLICSAFAIMLLGKAETVVIERVRVAVIDVVTPFLSALSQPLSTLSDGVNHVEKVFGVYGENMRLKNQNAHLLKWQRVALSLAAENENFRKLLNFVPENSTLSSTARVVGDSGGVFVRSVLINGGRTHNIGKGDAVLNGDGLVGRVAEVGGQSARVLLVTDLNSRVPVLTEENRVRGILAGDNSSHPKLGFIAGKKSVHPGQKIVTSGHGGVFPAGLPVGRVILSNGGLLRVRLFANLDQLEYVRVITQYPGAIIGPVPPIKVNSSRLK
tara:strand:+ start:71 stop:1021 length:951 start_codon:yes stop_codon:yes gene_type:complete